MRRIAAVDIGGTKIAAGVVSEDGTVLARVDQPTNPAQGFAPAMQRIQEMLQKVIDRCGPVAGLGVACPGPLDPATGIIGDVGTLPGWQHQNLADALGSHSHLTVVVENDADAAALAEYHRGTAQAAGTLIYITVSTGIGGGIVLDGQLYRGVRSAHPEFGHQVIDPSGPLCYCGLNGCWESLASGTAMSAWYREISPASSPLTAAEICDRARRGDELALRAVDREQHYLALGLANLVMLFCPDVITLGGGVMKSSDLFYENTIRRLRSLCTQVPVEETRITLSSLGQDIGLIGAAQSWLVRNP